MKKTFLISGFMILIMTAYGQQATVKEEYTDFAVYPFSEPNPVARPGNIYPYFRFDGYTSVPVPQKVKMVVLENRWIKVWIAPGIGGKVWGALNKADNRYFIYFNNVVKFRDIAMRGAWTSGGIEFNFGTIGHAPTTATPVDYAVRNNPDGSASCFLGAIDLPSGTEWRVEVRLPKDKAFFEVNSSWNNPGDLKTSLYHWQTAAANASPDLQFYFPGKAYIDHSGNAFPWPVLEDGRDISLYRNNNYNSSHSYHVLGEYTDWFAGYYHGSGYGFGHWTRYPYKPGKKIWIWDLSRAGAIWADLLTDKDKGNRQYIEMQTGLLFNQEGEESTMSPFKHQFFEPGATENFSELWFPLHRLSGVSAISREGVLDVSTGSKGLDIRFQSLGYLADRLMVTDSTGALVNEFNLALEPEQIFEGTLPGAAGDLTFKLAGGELYFRTGGRNPAILDRPLTSGGSFDWGSVYGLYTMGIEKSRQRLYPAAEGFFRQCLQKDSSFLPAFTALADLKIRQLRYDEAIKDLLRVIAFNTYDPEANWLYASLLEKQGKYDKARDAFGITLRSPMYRAAALNRLAMIALREKRYEEAWEYISDAGQRDATDRNICRTAAVTARLRGDQGTWDLMLRRMSNLDPLCHFADFERFFVVRDSAAEERFTSRITNEFASETYIEIALWYLGAGLDKEARSVMRLCPQNVLADYLSAYLADKEHDQGNCDNYLSGALGADDSFVFPFRTEYEGILKWAREKQPSWKTNYYLGLLYESRQREKEAGLLFDECADLPQSWSFYLARGNFRVMTGSDGLPDYLTALKLGPGSWRTYHTLSNYYMSKDLYDKALETSEKAVSLFSSSSIIKYDQAVTLLRNGRYEECVELLRNTEILPHEGEGDGRSVWKFANLLNAIEYIKQGNPGKAREFAGNAYKWPENLGVGRPFKTDEREEDYIFAMISEKLGRKKEAVQYLKKVADFNGGKPEGNGSINYLTFMALRYLGRDDLAAEYLKGWLSGCPSAKIVSWATFMSENNPSRAAEVLKPNPPDKNGPWIAEGSDEDFRIISGISGID